MDIEKTIREYIEPLVHLSLATASDNAPWVCEVHYAYDDDLNVYFLSLVTRRHSQEIAANPKVAGNIVKQFSIGEAGVGVYFEGTAQLLEPGKEQNIAFACLKARLGIGEKMLEDAKRDDGHKFYKITVDNWYVFGKFDGQPSQKYQLVWHGGSR